jgi:UDP-N-acetylglucosamine acyltransferase
MNLEGLKRRGFSADALAAIKRAYKIVWRQKLSLDDALAELTALAQTQAEIQPLIDSIRASTRGIVR